MPIRLEVSRLHRLVMIVARGHVTPEEIHCSTQELVQANVPHFAKIIDIAGATSELTPEQVERISVMLRETLGSAARGPVAFVINPDRQGLADVFADVTKGDRPVKLFRSLHEARKWLQTVEL